MKKGWSEPCSRHEPGERAYSMVIHDGRFAPGVSETLMVSDPFAWADSTPGMLLTSETCALDLVEANMSGKSSP